MEGLKQQIEEMKQSFLTEELVDNYFIELEQLQDMDSPDFVQEVMDLFFRDSNQLLALIEIDMNTTPLNPAVLDKNLHQLKGTSASVGANKVKLAVNLTSEHLKQGNVEGVRDSLEQVKNELSTLKAKLDAYFQLQKQAVAAGAGTGKAAAHP